jgi:hypothetical protein
MTLRVQCGRSTKGGNEKYIMESGQTISPDSPEAYINRELSWLDFARRVLELAEDPLTPLLERVKFAGIMGMIYDEFAMKRIGGLRRRIEKGNNRLSPDGRTPPEELQLCRREFQRQAAMLCDIVDGQLRPALAAAGIPLLGYDQLDDGQRAPSCCTAKVRRGPASYASRCRPTGHGGYRCLTAAMSPWSRSLPTIWMKFSPGIRIGTVIFSV